MKKVIIMVVIIAIIITSIAFFLNNNNSINDHEEVLSFSQNTSKKLEQNNTVDVEINGDIYTVSWMLVEDIDEISLVPNFDKKLTSLQAMDEYGCKNLVNGGFYSKEELPIGLFVSEEGQMQKFGTNRLLNGVLYIDNDEKVGITRNIQGEDYKLALQTGPILRINNNTQELEMANDKKARRMVAAITKDNTITYLAVYNSDSYFVGPYLEELPELVEKFGDEAGIDIIDAINLDGGSASVFYSDTIKLSEISMVGSFFCIK